MNDLPVTDTAFAGFRVMKERLAAFPAWVLLSFVWTLALDLAMIAMGFHLPDAAELQSDPQAALAFVARFAPALLAMFAASLVVNAVVTAAMNRVVLRPAEGRWGYIRLGGAELLQLGVLTSLALIIAAVYLGLVVAGAILTGLAGLAGKPVAIIVGAMSLATGASILAVLGVRLSLSASASFVAGRFDLAASWRLTRGRFWPVLGVYVLATALTLVVLLLAWLVELGLGAAVTLGHMQAFVSGEPQTVSGLLDPIFLFQRLLGSIVNALVWPLLLAPAPTLYRHLSRA